MRTLLPALVIAMIPALSTASTPELSRDLRTLAGHRVFFGHQSVGKNILDGIEDLRREAGVDLRLEENGTLDQPGIVHAYLGTNTAPLSKIEAFVRAVDAGAAGKADIAFFKFCYVDFDAGTDVRALFDAYRSALEGLRSRHPATTFVHVTVPLTVTQTGLKAHIKQLLGKSPWGERENLRREEFNGLLRSTFGGKEPLFDLARAESTREDGVWYEFERDGARHPSLVPEYTDDGEHLNERGRRRVARELVGFLASLVTR